MVIPRNHAIRVDVVLLLDYVVKYPPTCSKEELIQYTKNAKTVSEKPASEKDDDSWDIFVDDGAKVLLPSSRVILLLY